ncbi:bifunctional adenosylcobinamide kinase/adenosylcobinamide-phosphate guanylyltransferase [Sporosarcina ureilytica]|uniref:Uncharacterized protein n=1 Tax=Sporosarcina ureilytica TaxID=298596 RepID=A0A1D8JJI7_9BACL|nr:bifunctional adenosylcobinamide kinase/adenosylcobinamide-phosphate guanylyltransferase [Sporosarcina ureilytica]AOV08864.1 hypothetical protein BI350_15780 [Sporosarcina ureilytica]
MRVVIGGAHNGKRAYVNSYLEAQKLSGFKWYEGTIPPIGSSPVVVAGLEDWLRCADLDEEEAIQVVMNSLENRSAIVILTDIGRGIVPIDKNERQLRDSCGRLYQKLVAEAEEVIQVWYGIPKKIKGRGNGR